MADKNKWFILILSAFLFNGIPGIMAKSVIMTNLLSKYWYILFFYAGGLALSLIFIKKIRKIGLLFGLVAGVFSFFGTLFLILSLENLPSYAVFPVANGGIIPLTAVCAYFIFGEKLSKREFLGVLVGIMAIALFSLG